MKKTEFCWLCHADRGTGSKPFIPAKCLDVVGCSKLAAAETELKDRGDRTFAIWVLMTAVGIIIAAALFAR